MAMFWMLGVGPWANSAVILMARVRLILFSVGERKVPRKGEVVAMEGLFPIWILGLGVLCVANRRL